ncbi:MAG: C25 family cysteine peptidase, partial [Chromatiaceae bacterium]
MDPVSTATSWDNNSNTACNDITEAFPGTNSKCSTQLVQIGGFVVPPFGLQVNKTGPASVAPGETGTYVIEFWNEGDGPGGADPQAFNAVLRDELPVGLTVTGRRQSASTGDNLQCTLTFVGVSQQFVIECQPGNDDAVTPPNGIMDEHKPGVDEHIYRVEIDFRADVGYAQQTLTNEACVDANNNDPANPLDVRTCDQVTTTTPVTLSSFEATRVGDAVRFEWSTATEAGNVGFNVYAERGEERARLNEALIPSQKPSSLVPLDYEFEATDVEGKRFWIASVDIQGTEELRGPFGLEESHGRRTEPTRVDWAAIRAEKDTVKAAKKAEKAAAKAAKKQASRLSQLASTDSRTRGGKRKDASIATASTALTFVDLMVSQTGLYRVSAGELLAAGFDLKGVPTDQIALWRGGVLRPVRVVGDGDAIEFYGEAADTLYTDTARYTLGVAENPVPVIEDGTRPNRRITPPAHYLETVKVEKELAYSFIAPNGDPFYEAMLLAYGSPAVRTVSLPVDHYVSADNAPLPTLSVGMWGLTDWQDVEPDHRVTLSFNGTELTTEEFDGTVSHPVDVQLAADLVREGSNALTVTVTGDTGARWDMVALDDYSLTYPRAFVAREGRLSFGMQGAPTLRVDGLPSPDVVVYRKQGSYLTRMTNVLVKGTGGAYSATFAGSDEDATYLVSTVDALLEPASIEAPLALADIKSGSAQYLIIANGAFVDGLGDLVEAREAQGLSVKVVDVAQVYAQFGSEVIDPAAIRNYIAYAAHNLGTKSVLLVGGDCYDYLSHLDTGCVSFIPSLYDKTDPVVDFAPVDPKYADINGDGVPDVDIGRFPVSTSQELGWMIEKTLAYEDDLGNQSALFVADQGFGADSDAFLDQVSAALTAEKI